MTMNDVSTVLPTGRRWRPAAVHHRAGCGCPTCRRAQYGAGRSAAHGGQGCGCRKCREKQGEAELENFLGDIGSWLSSVLGGSTPATYPVTPGQEFGRKFGSSRPPGLPSYARQAGAEGSALTDVRAVATRQGLGDTFVKTVVQMAKTESHGRYGLPANRFNVLPPHARGGKSFISAWGVFQYNRDAWTCLFTEAERVKRRSYVSNGSPGCSGCKGKGGCVFPWDCTPQEEIERPILQYAKLFRDARTAGGSTADAAGGLRLFHITPAGYRSWLSKGSASGFAAAWHSQSASRRGRIRSFLSSAGVTAPAAIQSHELETLEPEMSELEEEVGSWAKKYPANVQEAIAMAMWPLAMQRAIDFGIRSANTLANIGFFTTNPDRDGRAISKSEPGAAGLIEAWKFFHSAAQNLLRANPQKSSPSKPASASHKKIPVAQVNTLMPSTAPGLVAGKPQSHRYGLPETIEALRVIGRSWQARHPAGPRIRIRDISHLGGGKFSPHGSHRMGIDVDIGLMRNDGREAGVNYKTQSSRYSRALTQEMVNAIRANGVLKVHRLWFGDRKVKNVNYDNIHNNHVHVRFCVPAKYGLAAMKRAAFPGGTRGTYASC